MEMAPSASFFQTKDALNGSINRNSLCRDISGWFFFFFFQTSGHLQCQQQRHESQGWVAFAGSSGLFFSAKGKREQGNSASWGSAFILSSSSNPFISWPVSATSGRVQMSNSCCNELLEKSQEREEREEQYNRVEGFSLCSELPANTREPPGDRDQVRRDVEWSKEEYGWLLLLFC